MAMDAKELRKLGVRSTMVSGGVIAMAGQTVAVDIVGHRGASWDAPENTVASYRLAWDQGADAAEVDVYLTRDNRIVAMHDRTTKRTTGVDWVIAERMLDELRTLDAGSWKDPRWKGEPIPTLTEVLATIPEGRRLYIEVKCGPEIVPFLKEELKASGRSAEQTVVMGFGLDTVREVKTALSELKVYWLSGWRKDKDTGQWLTRVEDLIADAREAGADGLDLAADGPLDEEAVGKIRDAGLEFHVWTVNDPAVARRMVALGVDSITTDRPGWLREQLASSSD